MPLFLGKFNPDTDLKADLTLFDGIEIEASSYLTLSEKTRLSLRKHLLKLDLRVIVRVSLRKNREFEEWVDLLNVLIEDFSDRLVHFSFYSGFRSFDEIRDEPKLFILKKALIDLPEAKFCFEAGQSDSEKSLAFILRIFAHSNFAFDLDWHSFSAKFSIAQYKLNGWHSERWVRRYGDLTIQKLCKKLKNSSLLVLAHSGRFEEASLFKNKK